RCASLDARTPLDEAQRGLAAKYLPLAQSLATRYRALARDEAEDLESAAYLALVEAAQAFDPTRKVNFATFARHRIRGALRDYHYHVHAAHRREDKHVRPVYNSMGNRKGKRGMVIGAQPEPPVGADVDSIDAVEHWLSRLPWIHSAACRYIYIYGT